MIVNQASLKGLNVSYSAAYNKAFEGVKSNYEKIATTVPSTTAETNYKWLGQIPQMREWIGDREIQSLSAYDYIIKNKKFEMTVSVPRDDIEDDQYGIYTPLFSNMGESAAQHPDILCFDALKAGFTEKCYDGKTFFAEDHPSGEGGKKKVSNLSHDKLDADSYEAARTAMMSITGDKGKSLNLVPNLLVVSPANEKAALLEPSAVIVTVFSSDTYASFKISVSSMLPSLSHTNAPLLTGTDTVPLLPEALSVCLIAHPAMVRPAVLDAATA